MKISPQWLRDFVDLQVNYHQLADDLTLAGIAVESISGEGDGTVFDMDITTNRPDAMNHFGVARECSAIYNLPLKPIAPQLPSPKGSAEFHIQIDEPELCPRFTGRVLRDVTIKPSPAQI
jgi:phenylalanyl-tRNA synthetase beta chain